MISIQADRDSIPFSWRDCVTITSISDNRFLHRHVTKTSNFVSPHLLPIPRDVKDRGIIFDVRT
jgi:hypothetical protein